MARGKLAVTAEINSDPGAPEQGVLVFVDNAVDPTTGTIHLRATFTNSQNRLWPGLFVNIILTLSEQRDAIIVPAQAIVEGEKGPFVYIVKSDKRVEPRTVVTDRTVDGETVIEKGLQPGETVVTDGQTRLQPNARVEVKGSSEATTAEPPAQQ